MEEDGLLKKFWDLRQNEAKGIREEQLKGDYFLAKIGVNMDPNGMSLVVDDIRHARCWEAAGWTFAPITVSSSGRAALSL